MEQYKDEVFCAFYDEEDCLFEYTYSYDEEGKLVIRAEEKKECPPQVYILSEFSIIYFIVQLKYFILY